MSGISAAERAEVMRVRTEMIADGETNSAGGPSCGTLSEELNELFGWAYMYGAYRLPDGSAPEHAWNFLPDGTIIDASADQFGGLAIEIIPLGDPRAENYLDQEGDDLHDR